MLKLLAPRDKSYKIIESESPKFTSPTHEGKKGCPECGKSYPPLVFATNQVVDGQHFHDKTEGGVYFFTALKDALSVFVDSSMSGFIAVVESNGQIRNDRHNSMALRAERVLVREIKAYCIDLFCEYSYGTHKLHMIREGILMSVNPNCATNDDLQALCGSLKAHSGYFNRDIKYRFEIAENREVHFSSKLGIN